MHRMYRQIPNLLTVFRLVLAGGFFVTLNQYRYQGVDGEAYTGVIWASVLLFVMAVLTDVLDGYLARRWQVESTFGRIMDPFCDKVLIIGAFIYLAGPRFVIEERAEALFNMISGVYPWMVVVVLARELLVTGIRGELEGLGKEFGSSLSGKLKMILQSIAVPVVLALVWIGPEERAWAWWARDAIVYLTVAVTILSGLPYILTARDALRVPPTPSFRKTEASVDPPS